MDVMLLLLVDVVVALILGRGLVVGVLDVVSLLIVVVVIEMFSAEELL